MVNYRVYVGEHIYQVSVGQSQLKINGDLYQIDLESLNGNGLHLLRHPTRNVETYLEPVSASSYQVQIDGKHLCAEVDFGLQNRNRKKAENTGEIKSPMPGLIVEVLVKPGDHVLKGEPVLIQEAMKMQMKVRTAVSGTIQNVQAQAGAEVEKGKTLITVHPDPGSQEEGGS